MYFAVLKIDLIYWMMLVYVYKSLTKVTRQIGIFLVCYSFFDCFQLGENFWQPNFFDKVFKRVNMLQNRHLKVNR